MRGEEKNQRHVSNPAANISRSIQQYNIAYQWPKVLPGYYFMVYLRKRYLPFWSKYNYVLSAAFSSAIAIAAVIIFFAVSYNGFEIDWWGNNADTGCEAKNCVLKTLPKGEYFGPRIGTYAT